MNGNTYYKYKKRQGQSHRVLELTVVDDPDNGNLKLEVMDSLNRPGRATITLTEQEEDRLIAEILRRRGYTIEWLLLPGNEKEVAEVYPIKEPISSIPKTEYP